MLAKGTKDHSLVYSPWLGKSVVMLVVIRQCHLPMHCLIVAESVGDVRVRIQPGWEIDIRKDLILAVEEVVIAAKDRVDCPRAPSAPILTVPARLSIRPLDTSAAVGVSRSLRRSEWARRLAFTN
jgi:hypothetical protein